MPRHPLPLVIEDLSAFAANLRQNWPDAPPNHAATLALIARAAGYRNHQHLRAEADWHRDPGMTEIEARRLRDALRCFDAEGRLARWPQGRDSVQPLALSAIWARIPARRDLTEAEVNDAIRSVDATGDHVLLRRELISRGWMRRERDGSRYRRVERRPTEVERSLIRTVGARWLAPVLEDQRPS